MIYYRCEDDAGGTAGSDQEDESSDEGSSQDDSEETSDNDDSGSDSDTDFDYQSYMGGSSKNENPMGLSLGADEYVERIEEMREKVDRYSPQDYIDRYYEPHTGPLPGEHTDRTYSGAPDESLWQIDLIPASLDSGSLKVGWVSFDYAATNGDYGAGMSIGKSYAPGKGPLEFDARTGVFINFENPGKSGVFAKLGAETPVVEVTLAEKDYSIGDLNKDAENLMQMLYEGALNAIGYPRSYPANPW